MRVWIRMPSLLMTVVCSSLSLDTVAIAQEESLTEERRHGDAMASLEISSCHLFVFQSGAGNWKDFVSGSFFIDADNGVYHGSNPDRLIFQSGAGNWKDFVSGGFFIDADNGVYHGSNPDRLIFQSGAGNWKDFVGGGFFVDDDNRICVA